MKFVYFFCLTIIISACSQHSPVVREPSDGAPSHAPLNLAQIEDAVPRLEPKSKYGNPPTYEVFGKTYRTLNSAKGYHARGIASWYGTKFHGKRTSSGEPYDMYAMTAAHKTLPLPTYLEVTNLDNGRRAIVRVNDRGPFKDDRIIDLSYAAAVKLGIAANGTGRVEIRTITPDASTARSPTQPQETANNTPLFLQAGAFSSRQNAESLRIRIADAVKPPVSIHKEQRPEGDIYRVRIGPLYNEDEAQHVNQRLARIGIAETYIQTEERDK